MVKHAPLDVRFHFSVKRQNWWELSMKMTDNKYMKKVSWNNQLKSHTCLLENLRKRISWWEHNKPVSFLDKICCQSSRAANATRLINIEDCLIHLFWCISKRCYLYCFAISSIQEKMECTWATVFAAGHTAMSSKKTTCRDKLKKKMEVENEGKLHQAGGSQQEKPVPSWLPGLINNPKCLDSNWRHK